MGWLFMDHCQTKEQLVNEILRPREHVRFHAHSVRGNTLWTVEQGMNKNGSMSENFIGCYRLSRDKQSGSWGYKDMCESMHPYYYDCPLKFLEMAPVENNDWRMGVIAYHDSKARQRQAFKGLKVGCEIQLKPTCTVLGNRVTAPIKIIALKPLMGTINGMMIRIKKTHIASIL